MKQRKLASHISQIIIASLLAPMLISIWLAVQTFAAWNADARDTSVQQADSFAARVDSGLESRLRGIELFAESTLFDGAWNLAEVYDRALDFRETYGSDVVVADASFEMLLSTTEPLGTSLGRLPLPEGRSAVMSALETGQPAIGDIVFGPVTNQKLVGLAAPIVRDGNIIGFCVTTLRLGFFQALIDRIRIPPGWSLTLRDSTGAEMASIGPEVTTGRVAAVSMHRVNFEQAPWTLTLSLPPLLARQRVLHMVGLLAIAIGLAIGGSILGGRYASRRLLGDVKKLAVPGPHSGDPIDIEEIATVKRKMDANSEELRRSEASHREIFQANPYPMWVCDIETQGFLAVNDAAIREYGYSREEFLSMTLEDLRPADEVSAPLEDVGAVDSRHDEAGISRHETKYGQLIDVEIASHALTFMGRRAELVRANNVTSQRQAEQALADYRDRLEDLVELRTRETRAAEQRAAQASEAKTLFLAHMSHEIRTPLNAILGLSHLLKSDAPPAQLAKIAQIETAGRHLLSIITDILDLTKIEAGELHLEPVDFTLPALLDEVSSIVASDAASKNLEVVVDADIAPVWLRGDSGRLRQALLNYVNNAIKFSESGTVILRARVVDERPELLKIRFEVEDTGIGIPSDKLERIFEPFRQADGSTTRTHGGTGLGLSITRHLAESMGGEAGADSTPGAGSTFWFSVWLGRGHEAAHQQGEGQRRGEPETYSAAQGRSVLVVEDNPVNREVAKHLLEIIGLNVSMAEDGLAAVEMAQESRYDAVLMDVQMPRMDGLEATRRLRAIPGWEQIPVIAMTANAFQEDRAACREAGMNDFIAKPVEPGVLYSVVTSWIESQGSTPPDSGEPPSGNGPKNAGSSLPRVEGLDTRAGLEFAGNRTDVYRQVLEVFVDTYRDAVAAVAEMVQAEDFDRLRSFAHQLKSSARMVGAGEIASAAELLQDQAFNGEPDAWQRAQQLADDLQSILSRLEDALKSASPARPA